VNTETTSTSRRINSTESSHADDLHQFEHNKKIKSGNSNAYVTSHDR